MSGCFDNYAIFTTTAGLRLRCFLDRASHKVLKGHGFSRAADDQDDESGL
jgi:hypothetical protein